MSDAAVLTAWSHLLLASLAEAGLREVVLSPGSRSTPLTLAAGRTPGLRLTTVLDERCAAFHALGQARVSGVPSLLLCTSGTAGAHYLPAVIEASQAGLPLLILTADRPFSLQGCDAPQTIDQRRLYGDFVRLSMDLGEPTSSLGGLRALRRIAAQAVAASRWPLPGPVHLNARASKPLEPDGSAAEAAALRGVAELLREPAPRAIAPLERPDPATLEALDAALAASRRPLVVAGPAPLAPAEPLLRELARLGLPALVEGSSQLRWGPAGGLMRSGFFDLLLRDPPFRREMAPDLVIQLGLPPTSGSYERWAGELRCRRVVIRPRGWSDPQSTAEILWAEPREALAGLAPPTLEQGWREAWEEADERAWEAVAEAIRSDPAGELSFAAAAVEALPQGALLMLGNSLPIRAVDAAAPTGGHALGVLCQRGVNGIDGLVSGAAGAASVSGRPTLLLLGDQSLLHDVGGLALAAELRTPLVIVVQNNGGGRIFEQLPLALSPGLTAEELARFTTPQGRPLRHAAALYGIPHALAESAEALSEAIRAALRRGGPTLVEAEVNPSSYKQQLQRIQARLAEGR